VRYVWHNSSINLTVLYLTANPPGQTGLGESHLHFKNYSHAHITIGSRGSLPDPHKVTIIKVKSHVEHRKRQRSEWTQHEKGNVLADIAASPRPDQLKASYPTSINISITASELVFQITPRCM
jgi:hypothetical protein